ncbi:MAG: hypothetical protein A3J29_12160 [Acidobacteria bacterium RIFCSPLOWO2_12_FULL_67_14b]|nr:MAG: hypothetical protein A3J29_12160 [Acidobacteria bacterium RIFCSPLOWO2_12_FULL_67_14b]
MQDRRFRPGDVLDDYCPRERRITDHAIVAMIDDEIRRTRCGVCDAEHEYKEAKVPAPRRKTQPPALFTQVLDGLQGPNARPQAPAAAPTPVDPDRPLAAAPAEPPIPGDAHPPAFVSEIPLTETEPPPDDDRDEGPIRRSLIRAQFPKIEGAMPAPRALPEFTIQTLNNRRNNGGQRHAGGQGKFRRRRPGGGQDNNVGPMRFRDPHAQAQGDGRSGQGQGQGQGGGRRRRGGKKNR